MAAKLKIAVLGATGYSGLELTRLLLRHPLVDKPVLLRRPDNQNSDPLKKMGKGRAPSENGNGEINSRYFSCALRQWEVSARTPFLVFAEAERC